MLNRGGEIIDRLNALLIRAQPLLQTDGPPLDLAGIAATLDRAEHHTQNLMDTAFRIGV